ncbi:PREDICTED: putative T-cell leukemia/lymphoma protein 6, partial [Galeopterus variegatus]|uniref:T-cell leukemia/lymphoma protein 6 n=1 Tax=Galeopterus variegatus TaxID=482537 RepID=A0ABM0SEK2_GALVR
MESIVTQRRLLDGHMGKTVGITDDVLQHDHKCSQLSPPAKCPEVDGLQEAGDRSAHLLSSQAFLSLISMYMNKTQQARKRARYPHRHMAAEKNPTSIT